MVVQVIVNVLFVVLFWLFCLVLGLFLGQCLGMLLRDYRERKEDARTVKYFNDILKKRGDS